MLVFTGGVEFTVTAELITLSLQPLLEVTTSFTLYTPAFTKLCTGLICVEVVPSPKLQKKVMLPELIDEVLVKLKLFPARHCAGGEEKAAIGLGLTVTITESSEVHPLTVLVAIT